MKKGERSQDGGEKDGEKRWIKTIKVEKERLNWKGQKTGKSE